MSRLIVTLFVNGVSYGGIQEVTEVLGGYISQGKIRDVIAGAAVNARQIDASVIFPAKPVWVAVDEIYVHGKPLLVAVEEQSMAVFLAKPEDAADETTWGCHFLDLEDRGVRFASIIIDQGTGLSAGWQASGIGAPRQLDVFHTLKEAKDIAGKMGRRAKVATATVEDGWARLENQTNPHRAPGRPRKAVTLEELERLEKAADIAASLAADMAYLTVEMARSLSPLHHDGSRRTVPEAREELAVIAELWQTIPEDNARKFGQNLPERIPGLTHFLFSLEEEWRPWEEYNKEAASFVGWVWSNRKALGETPPATDDEVRKQWGIDLPVEGVRPIWDSLEHLHRASSLVECMNSILRHHAHAHRSLTPDLPTLLMFRHNRRSFRRGNRAGKSPIELLSGEPASWTHWTDGLFGSRHPGAPEVQVQQEADTLEAKIAA